MYVFIKIHHPDLRVDNQTEKGMMFQDRFTFTSCTTKANQSTLCRNKCAPALHTSLGSKLWLRRHQMLSESPHWTIKASSRKVNNQQWHLLLPGFRQPPIFSHQSQSWSRWVIHYSKRWHMCPRIENFFLRQCTPLGGKRRNVVVSHGKIVSTKTQNVCRWIQVPADVSCR